MGKRGASDMLDPEAIVLKSGTLVIITLGVFRIVLHDLHKIRTDFRRWRRRH